LTSKATSKYKASQTKLFQYHYSLKKPVMIANMTNNTNHSSLCQTSNSINQYNTMTNVDEDQAWEIHKNMAQLNC